MAGEAEEPRPAAGRTTWQPGAAAALLLVLPVLLLLTLHGQVEAAAGTSGRVAAGTVTLALGVVLVVGGVAAWWLLWSRPSATSGLLVALLAAVLATWWPATWVPADGVTALRAVPLLAVVAPTLLAALWVGSGLRAAGLACVLALAGGALHVATYDPHADPGCTLRCVVLDPVAGPWLSGEQGILLGSAAAALAGLVGLLQVARHRGRLGVPLATGLAAALAVATVSALLRTRAWGQEGWLPDLALLTLPVALLCSVAVLAEAGQRWRRRRLLRRLLASLTTPGRPGAPVLHFQVPATDEWVDTRGRQVARSEGQELVPGVKWVGGRIPAPRDTAVSGADRMVLLNARSAAVTLARQDQVRDSQQRVVALSDERRRAVESDLHDGAQQRLVGIKLHLALGREGLTPVAVRRVEEAEGHVQAALEGLRSIAHGLFPRLLDTAGLVPAVEDLVSRTAPGTRLEIGPLDGDLSRPVALAAYATVATVLRTSDPRARRTITVRDRDGELVVRVRSADRLPPAEDLVELEDRVGAAAGHLRCRQDDGLLDVEVRLPCGS